MNSRSKRDVNIVLRDITHNPVTTWGNQFGEGGACLTAKATYGKCTSFKTCYPYFKYKIPNLSIFDTWVLGQYDTCTYFADDGRQAFGVCCTDPPKDLAEQPAVAYDDENVVLANKDTVSNWPPPYITHPPNHAAPTHPPVQGMNLIIILSQDFQNNNSIQFNISTN